MKLWVDESNPDAAAFYRSLGFEATGESRPVSSESTLRASSMEMRLAGEVERAGGKSDHDS